MGLWILMSMTAGCNQYLNATWLFCTLFPNSVPLNPVNVA